LYWARVSFMLIHVSWWWCWRLWCILFNHPFWKIFW
jgi:hypothetical protein